MIKKASRRRIKTCGTDYHERRAYFTGKKYETTMKNKLKGFTLVELIVSMALLSILMIMVGLMFRPIGRLFENTTNYTKDRYIIDEINEVIDSNLKFATNVMIVYDTKGWRTPDQQDAATAFGLADLSKVRLIEICNVRDIGFPGIDPNVDSDGYLKTGRIIKKDNEHGGAWPVGSPAFYGDGNYFINLETVGGASPMVSGNQLQFTTYSIDKDWEPTTDLAGQTNVIRILRDFSPSSAIAVDYGADNRYFVENYSTHDLIFVNNPSVTLIDRTGATDQGVNIVIYYTLPGDV